MALGDDNQVIVEACTEHGTMRFVLPHDYPVTVPLVDVSDLQPSVHTDVVDRARRAWQPETLLVDLYRGMSAAPLAASDDDEPLIDHARSDDAAKASVFSDVKIKALDRAMNEIAQAKRRLKPKRRAADRRIGG